jgi:hypothetical protein
VFSAIHNDPNQKKERKQAKKFCRKSQKASRLGVVGFSNSKIKMVIIIARTASVNTINLSFFIGLHPLSFL